MPEYETVKKDERILCVEGIYDKYSIEMLADLPENCRIFPSVNAEAIINNIQYFLAYQKPYVALWDNDEEGKKCFGKAKKVFGIHESENFLLLPESRERRKRLMEEMYDSCDMELFKVELGLPLNATYEAVISALYFCDSCKRKSILKKVSAETKDNFARLSKMIKSCF